MVANGFSRCQTAGRRIESGCHLRAERPATARPCPTRPLCHNSAPMSLACPATACRWRRSPTRWARRSTSTAPRRSATRIARFDAAFAAFRTRCTTRSRRTRRSPSLRLLRALGSGADANSGGEIDVALPRRLRSGRHRLHRRRQDARRAGARRHARASRRSTPNRRASSTRIDAVAGATGRAGPRGRARQSRHRRPTATRTSRPGCGRTSSACRSTRRGRCTATWLARPRRRAGRRPRPHRVADPVARPARARGRAPSRTWRASCGTTASRSSTSTSAAGSASRTTATDAPSADELRGAPSCPRCATSGVLLLLEPGRAIVGPAGALVATRRRHQGPPRGRAGSSVLDTGMTELLRPALYGAFHRIEPVRRRPGPAARCDIVGPLCESSDVVGRDRVMPPLEVGDLMAIFDVGAYGASMASTYNRRPLPPEVLVDEGRMARRSGGARRSMTCVVPGRVADDDRSPDRVRGPRSKRQGDAGRACSAPASKPAARGSAIFPFPDYDDRDWHRDRAGAAGRAGLRRRT